MSVEAQAYLNGIDISVHRMAVIRPTGLDGLLDAVPAFRALRQGFPDAEITLVSLPGASDFAHRFSHYIDRFVPFYGFPDPRDQPHAPFLMNHSTQDRADDERYDLVVQMVDGSERSNGWARALRGRMIAGYFSGEAPAYLTLAATYPAHASEVQKWLRLTSMIGCEVSDESVEFPLFLEDQGAARRALSRMRRRGHWPIVAIHTGANADTANVVAVARAISNIDHRPIVLTGAGAPAVRARMHAPVEELAGRLSIGALAAIFQGMRLVVTADPDMARLAEAVGAPVLTLGTGRAPESYARAAHEILARVTV